jgi:peptide-methionine (S)-S-oxide reductase
MRTPEELEEVEPGELEPEEIPENLESTSFGMGCFWGVEALFGSLEDVYRTRVGYTGGKKQNPTYRSLGKHTETTQVLFDPEEISYDRLLEIFFENHDYESSRKAQYASRIFVHTKAQREEAERALKSKSSAATIIEDLETFWLAEDYHQKYRLRQYPDLMALFSDYDPEQFIESVVAAKLNAAVAGNEVDLKRWVPDSRLEKVEKQVQWR